MATDDKCDHGMNTDDFCEQCNRLYGDPEWAWLMGLEDFECHRG